MTEQNILTKNTDEIIALMVVGASIAGWFLRISIPSEPLMLVLFYYFGKKLKGASTNG